MSVPQSVPQCRVIHPRDVQLFQVLKIDSERLMSEIVYGPEDNAVVQFIQDAEKIASNHQDVICYQMAPGCKISCVNWDGRHFISGTDIVKFLMQRYVNYCGRRPHNAKKFEEGVFSDLRRLQAPRDCQLEGTRSDFLCFMFDYECVRSKKKQKVFLWQAFKRCFDSLFCDALQRELARIEMAKSVGMSIDQFTKSGIIPTGSSSVHDIHRKPLTFDWVALAAARINCGDNDGASLMAIVQVDQVHFVRNDINSCIDRNIRVNLPERKKAMPDWLQVDELCKVNTSKGVRAAVPVSIPVVRVAKKAVVRKQVVEHVETSSESDLSEPSQRPKRIRAVSKIKSVDEQFVQTPNLTPNVNSKTSGKPGSQIRYNPYGVRQQPFPFMRRFSVTQSWSHEADSDEEAPNSELFKQMQVNVDMPPELARSKTSIAEAAAILVNLSKN